MFVFEEFSMFFLKVYFNVLFRDSFFKLSFFKHFVFPISFNCLFSNMSYLYMFSKTSSSTMCYLNMLYLTCVYFKMNLIYYY